MQEILISAIKTALQSLGVEVTTVTLERPGEMRRGDFSTNVALATAKQKKINPVAFAVEVVDILRAQGISGIEKIEVAGPGFINFYQAPNVIKNGIKNIFDDVSYGKSKIYEGKKMAFEYTDPNPFKQFHIGHLMANTIGESLSRLAEFGGGEVKRFCYQGDVGKHVALTLWGFRFIEKSFPSDDARLGEKVAFLGEAYAKGAQTYRKLEEESTAQIAMTGSHLDGFLKADGEVREINKKVYERSDESLNEIYDKGREWSLEHFEELYKVLDTTFDRYFFESEATKPGMEIVKENTAPDGKAIFKESEGAIVFPGEAYGLHTRVFLTKEGLPTYEGKELGLAKLKYAAYPYDRGMTVTGNEQDGYFQVVLKVSELLFPELVGKLAHVSHGMLRLTSGKMSSRTGDVITGESLLNDMREMALERMKDRDISDIDRSEVAEAVAVGAIRYTVLRQASGKDIIFDPDKSLSFEGDSGPYLQYSVVRAKSILDKAAAAGITASADVESSAHFAAGTLNWSGGKLERMLQRFGEVATYAAEDSAPHHVANYVMELAGMFNSFYASTLIVNKEDASSPYKLAVVGAFVHVMTNGLWLLGIKVPSKM